MALVLVNRVQELGTANTTVSFTLSGALQGFQSFAVIGNTNTTYYSATDQSGNWEVGLGTYSTTGPILTRTTIYASSNAGSAVTFAGTVNVFVTYPSNKSVNLDASGNVSALGTVASGTWNGGAIATAYGGTGLSGATPFTSGGAVYATSATGLTSGTLPLTAGGTGATSASAALTSLGAQAALVSGTNIKTVNSTSLLGSGDVAVQATLVSGTNIKTINSTSLLGSGNIAISASPAGASNQIQYNSSGAFAASSGFVFTNPTPGQYLLSLGAAAAAWNGGVNAFDLWNITGNNGGGIASTGGNNIYFTSNAYYAASGWLYKGGGAAGWYSIGGGTHQWASATGATGAGTSIIQSYLMTLDSSGNLQLNTTNNTARMWIDNDSSAQATLALKDLGTTYSTSVRYCQFVNSSGAFAGTIQHTAVTTVAYSTTSDQRLKENIVDAPNSLALLRQIKVRSYDWKEDKLHVDFGFVAQELHPLVPEAVGAGDYGETITNQETVWHVEYGRMTPFLTKVVKDQLDIIDQQQTLIAQLQADMAQVKDQINQLKMGL